MPISRHEYESGEIEPSAYILQVLRGYSDTAFTLEELLTLAASEGRSLSRQQLLQIMHGLVEAGTAESKSLKDVVYYIYYKRPLGFRPS